MTSRDFAGSSDIIWDGRLLSGESNDVAPVGLQEKIAELKTCLAPMLRGESPLNVWLHGPPGSGKTMLARRLVHDVCNTSERTGLYVNCWHHRSLYSVLQAIIDELRILGAEAQDTNVKFDRIRQALRGKPAVIMLDEIDRPMPQQRDEIIYGLLSLPRTGVVCISETAGTFAMLDERVRSRLGPVLLELPAYSRSEVCEIITDRARRALAPDSWSNALIKSIADLSEGDARLALQTLRQAAARAEEAGNPRLEARLVKDSLQRWQAIRQQARLTGLSEHERIIRDIVARETPLGTTRLQQLYAAYCRRHDLQPMARRTFTKYLSQLSAAGFLKVTSRSRPGGRMVRALSV